MKLLKIQLSPSTYRFLSVNRSKYFPQNLFPHTLHRKAYEIRSSHDTEVWVDIGLLVTNTVSACRFHRFEDLSPTSRAHVYSSLKGDRSSFTPI